jgi:CRISPR-associated endonuclease Cas2
MLYVASYDIGDDRRRSSVSDLLHALGPRVQQSVFEIEVDSKADTMRLVDRLNDMVDTYDDQVRLYRVPGLVADRHIIGERRLEERQAFYIL